MTHLQDTSRREKLSIIVPAYNEAQNLPVLYERLCTVMDDVDMDWEWIIVDDHSEDATFDIISDLAQQDDRIRGLRMSRNHGSFSIIQGGLQCATGDCAVVLAADLQDPPEVIPDLIERWQEGNQVVWAARRRREGEKMSTLGFARLYYVIMRHFVGLKKLPSKGADFFLLDRAVIDQLGRFKEKNISLIPLLTWMGYRQECILYDKQARLHGESGWNLTKKLKLFVDSVTSFSYLPIRLFSFVGFLVALAGFIFATVVVVEKFQGKSVVGYASLMVAILVIGGFQMLMIGILGEYLWRALDEARGRPRFLVEQEVGAHLPAEHQHPPDQAVQLSMKQVLEER